LRGGWTWHDTTIEATVLIPKGDRSHAQTAHIGV
jgi:hypothetical protein